MVCGTGDCARILGEPGLALRGVKIISKGGGGRVKPLAAGAPGRTSPGTAESRYLCRIPVKNWNRQCLARASPKQRRLPEKEGEFTTSSLSFRVAVMSAKNHKRQRRKRQSVTAK